MSLGTTLTIIQSGTSMTVPIEQVYAASSKDTPQTIIVNMTVPNLVGTTATPTPGPYVIDSFKVMLRHQNSHALTNAGAVLNVGPAASMPAVVGTSGVHWRRVLWSQ